MNGDEKAGEYCSPRRPELNDAHWGDKSGINRACCCSKYRVNIRK